MSDQSNIFVLTIDSLSYQWFEQSSQQLADLVDGVNFTNAFSPASYTSSAMPAITTGTYTDEIPAWGLPKSGEPSPIVEQFSQLGYDCGLWTDNHLFGVEYNYHRGFSAGNQGRPSRKKKISNLITDSPFERFFGLLEFLYFNIVEPISGLRGENNSFYRRAGLLNDQALSWLDQRQQNRPVFCWLHYMDTHHPYQPPKEYLERKSFNTRRSRNKLGEFTRQAIKSNGEGLTVREEEDVRTAYKACCEYISDELTSFVNTLEQRGYYNRNSDIIIITADHGEVLNREKYGMLGHVPPAFWDEIVHVPFVVGYPEWSQSVNNHQVSLIDLKSTLLDMLGVGAGNIQQPVDLQRDQVLMVSEWEEPNGGSTTTFRGIRSSSGKKCFGIRQNKSDHIFFTKTNNTGEKVNYRQPINESREFTNIPEEYRYFDSEIRQRGGFVEYNSGPEKGKNSIDTEHLRDLGYIE